MIRRRLAAALLFAAAATGAGAATPLLVDYDITSLTFIAPIYCTPGATTRVNACPGDGWSQARPITTAGASSTTVTGVVTADAVFALAGVGDIITFTPDQRSPVTLRRITAKASATSITVDAAVTIPAAGVNFRLWSLTPGTGLANEGWWRMPTTSSGLGVPTVTVVIDPVVINSTSVEYVVQCRQTFVDRYTDPVNISGTVAAPVSILAAAAGIAQRVTIANEGFDSCRVLLKETADSGVQKITISIESPSGH